MPSNTSGFDPATDPWTQHMRRSAAQPSGYVDVLNQSWPPPAAFAAHRNLREDTPPFIDVTVRIDFAGTGVEYLRGVARRWWTRGRCVLVVIEDDRVMTRMVWVSADDVRRR